VILRDGAKKTAGGVDLDALVKYLGAHAPLAPPARTHVARLN
jgi:hypothetical protein